MFRIICAIFVVAVHTHPLYDINDKLGYIGTQIIPRIGVPFFFCVSGFYFTKQLLAKKDVFIKTVKGLLKVYITWSFIYFLIDFTILIIKQQQPISKFIKHIVVSFFISGSYYHLWFFPALFFCIFVSTFFNKINLLKLLAYSSIFLYILGLLGCSYYQIGNQIPIIKILINHPQFSLIRRVVLMGLPFFMLGYFINILEEKYKDVINNRSLVSLGIIIGLLFLFEIILVIKFNLQVNIIITLFLYPLLAIVMMILLNNPLHEKKELAYKSRLIASFIYYSHPIFIMFLTISSKEILSIQMTETPLFLLTIFLTIIVGGRLIKLDNKWLNKVLL